MQDGAGRVRVATMISASVHDDCLRSLDMMRSGSACMRDTINYNNGRSKDSHRKAYEFLCLELVV